VARRLGLPQPQDLSCGRLQRVRVCTEPAVFLEAHKEARSVGSTDFAGSICAEIKNPAAYSIVSQQCVEKFPHSESENLFYLHFLVCYPFGSLKSLLLQSQSSRHCMEGPSVEHRLFHFIDFHLYGG